MDRAAFVRDVRERAAFEDDAGAERAITQVLGVLGTRLFEIDARAVADELPAAWAALLHRQGPEQEFELDELFRRVAQVSRVELGRAVERTQVVCQVLAERVSEDGLAHLHLRLPPAFAQLFTRRGPIVSAPIGAAVPAPGAGEPRRTLASGRPGSRNPLSGAQPARGQPGSVAASADPHAVTRLSSARGVSSERDAATLADASVDASRTLAGRDEDEP